MEQRIIDISGVDLPAGCGLRDFDNDLLLVGIGLTANKYEEIKNTLSADVQGRLIGWKRIGR